MKKITALLAFFALICFALPPGVNAAKLSEDVLSKKKEGYYVTGLPLVNFSSDDGFGYGARVYLYNNGQKDDAFFDSTPYFMQLYAQYFATTGGVQYHELNLDMPYFLGTKFRVLTALVYNIELNANYFGQGADAAQQKFSPSAAAPETFSKYADFADWVDDNEGYAKYYNYTIHKPKTYIYLFRNLTEELKLMVGAEFKYINIYSWKDEKFDGDRQIITKFDEDRDKLTGTPGGWTNFARFGIGYDTRDYEPDPNKGFYIDYCIEMGTGLLGSEYTWVKNNAQAQLYLNPVKSLVFAFRVGYTAAALDIPFYEEDYFGFALNRRQGLGGNRTLHGYKKSRFVGRTMTVGNFEPRWEFAEVSGAGQRFAFQLVGCLDAGNVYDDSMDPFTDPRFDDYKIGYGGGLAIAWNQATIVHFLYGRSSEDSSISIDFNYTF
ncbi:MAG TPA: hypothetical protein ENN21_07495 [Spirochaetes bacterium]|nr:hypothetical protein [Spirochaetota bacterium]